MIFEDTLIDQDIEIPAADRRLPAILSLPPHPGGVVAFAHGSGSGRRSPRNRFVARTLQEAGLATLMLDLLGEDEANDKRKVFDIPLLAERLQCAADWLGRHPATRDINLGLFGASTGAGAALVAAAREPSRYAAIVSRGGRVDLAGHFLALVEAPTLLIIGGNDEIVVDLNKQAMGQMRCCKELVIIPGATHLFEEEGALEEVSQLARDWFLQHLAPRKANWGNAP